MTVQPKSLKDLLNVDPVDSGRPSDTRVKISGKGISHAKGDAEDDIKERSESQIYVPAHPIVFKKQAYVEYEIRELENGPPFLPVFLTLDSLVRQLGTVQPWVRRNLPSLLGEVGAEYLVFEPSIDPDAWRWTSVDLERYYDALRSRLE